MEALHDYVHEPHARTLPGHETGASPPEQRTVHSGTLSPHVTRQLPSHSTTHDGTLAQLMVLFGPARTPQLLAS